MSPWHPVHMVELPDPVIGFSSYETEKPWNPKTDLQELWDLNPKQWDLPEIFIHTQTNLGVILNVSNIL